MKLPASRITFVVDFDGTIAPIDTVDSLLSQFADPSWEAIEAEWVQGAIDSRACLKRQLALVSAERVVLEEFFYTVALDSAFTQFVAQVRVFADIAVVSDGLDYPIFQAMQRLGLPMLPVVANQLMFTASGLDIAFPHAQRDCLRQSGVCKCAAARALGGAQVVLIGDGRSDQCLAQAADYVFAKGALARFCADEGIAFTPFETFSDLLIQVPQWQKTHFGAANRKRYAQ